MNRTYGRRRSRACVTNRGRAAAAATRCGSSRLLPRGTGSAVTRSRPRSASARTRTPGLSTLPAFRRHPNTVWSGSSRTTGPATRRRPAARARRTCTGRTTAAVSRLRPKPRRTGPAEGPNRRLRLRASERLIAQEPVEPRDSCRLLVVDRASGQIDHRIFSDLPEYLGPTRRPRRQRDSCATCSAEGCEGRDRRNRRGLTAERILRGHVGMSCAPGAPPQARRPHLLRRRRAHRLHRRCDRGIRSAPDPPDRSWRVGDRCGPPARRGTVAALRHAAAGGP
jgi:hypothetical protein